MRLSFSRAKTKKASEITEGRFPVDRLPAMTDERIWKGTGGNVEEIDVPSAGGLAIFGDGSDGEGTISENTNLSRDMYYDTLTINAEVYLNTKGYRVHVKGKLTNAGYIHSRGEAGAGAVGGAGGSAGSLGGGGAGGNEGLKGTDIDPGLGGDGGKGGGAGGAKGVVTAPAAADGGFRANPQASILRELATGDLIQGGAGGGGGQGGDGWGGGGGGGTMYIAAAEIDNSAGLIYSNGGKGVDAVPDNNGAGGGGGGVLVMVYGSLVSGTEECEGGAGGSNGDGAGEAGDPGVAGIVIKIQAT